MEIVLINSTVESSEEGEKHGTLRDASSPKGEPLARIGSALWQEMEDAAAKIKAKEALERKRKKLRRKEKRKMIEEDINVKPPKNSIEQMDAFLHATESAFIWIALLCLHVSSAPSVSSPSILSSLCYSPSFLLWLVEFVGVVAWGLFTYFCFEYNITSITLIDSLLHSDLLNNLRSLSFVSFFDALLAAHNSTKEVSEPFMIYQRYALALGSFIIGALVSVRVPPGVLSFFLATLPLAAMIGLLFAYYVITLKSLYVHSWFSIPFLTHSPLAPPLSFSSPALV